MKRKDIIMGLLIALAISAFLSPYASSFPDGLEWFAEKAGFLAKGEAETTLRSPIPDYAIPGIKNEKLATSLAGAVGTLVVFLAGYGAARLISRKRRNAPRFSGQL